MTGKILAALIIFVLFALVLPATAATLSAGTATVTTLGDTATIDLVLDEAPTGFAGYNLTISLSDPAVAEIVSVTFPSWATQKANGTLPADSTWIKAADLGEDVDAGATNIPVATIRIRGDTSGSTPVTVTINQMSDDLGSNLFPTLSPGSFIVNVPPPAPVAAFTASPQSGNAPLSVQFTDQSTGTGLSWAWDFNNDGTIDSTVQSPLFSYTSAGTYSVNLTVTNAGGSNSKIETNYITVTDAPVPAPVAAFTADPLSGNAPLSVQFTDQSTGTGLSWAWDFNNDGTIDSTVQSPSYSYASAGTYSVNLTVTNSGGSDSEVKDSYIVVSVAPPSPPVANFARTPQSGPAPLSVQFTDTSTNTPTAWAWDFENDGTIDNTTQNPVFVYNTPGTFSANLTATNAGGHSSIMKTVTVTEPGPTIPVVNFDADNRTGPAPLTVHFTDSSSGSPTAWAWDFNNDGTTDDTTQNPAHTYTTPGTYQVNLTASNAAGSAYRLKGNFIVVTVPNDVNPVVDFSADSRTGTTPFTVHFTDLSVTTPTAWAWDFQNDGTIDSTLQNPAHTFTSVGTYQVNLTVTNATGTKSRLKANFITVTSPTGPVLSITPVSPVITTGYTQQYQLTLSSAPTGLAGVNVSITLENPAVGRITAISMPAWGFLNKTPTLPATRAYIDCVDIGQQVQAGATNIPLGTITITGDTPGVSSIILAAIDCDADDGAMISPAAQSGQITVYTPVTANYAANTTAGNLPLSVQFTDLSSGSDISSRNWDFNNDGVTDSTETNPLCIFNTPGRYTVNLTVSNAFSVDSEVKTNYILVTRLVEPFPGLTNPPTDPDFDGLYEDINGNGRLDFDDVVMFYWNMQWIRDNSSVGIAPFDFNQNGRIDYDDVVALYQEILNA